MGREDPHELADELDKEADELSRYSAEVQRQVDEARQDWERKRSDESVPGALPPTEGTDHEGASDAPPDA